MLKTLFTTLIGATSAILINNNIVSISQYYLLFVTFGIFLFIYLSKESISKISFSGPTVIDLHSWKNPAAVKVLLDKNNIKVYGNSQSCMNFNGHSDIYSINDILKFCPNDSIVYHYGFSTDSHGVWIRDFMVVSKDNKIITSHILDKRLDFFRKKERLRLAAKSDFIIDISTIGNGNPVYA